MNLDIDAAWAAGLLLALIRMTAFTFTLPRAM